MTKFLLWFALGLLVFLSIVSWFIRPETQVVGCKPASACFTEVRGLTKTVFVRKQECPRGPK